MHRFYVKPDYIKDKLAIITGDELKHLRQVLRLKTGDSIKVFDGLGREYDGVIKLVGQDEASVELEEASINHRESPVDIWLVQGLPKGDKMEFIIQKATELGVKGIIPFMSQRSIVRLKDKNKAEKVKRWQKVAIEACKQCRRSYIPHVTSPQRLVDILNQLPTDRIILIPWEEGGRPLKDVLQDEEVHIENNASKKIIYILIGPEGGLEEHEVTAFKEYGAIPVTLGPRIMRTETAGLVSIAVTMYQWGDLG